MSCGFGLDVSPLPASTPPSEPVRKIASVLSKSINAASLCACAPIGCVTKISASGNINTEVTVEVYEGWEVAGVFTQDPDSIGPQQIDLMAFWGWDNAFSFNQNNSASSPGAGFNDITSSTYYKRLASKVPPSFRAGVTFVPTLPYNMGSFCINSDDGTLRRTQWDLETD